MNFRPCIDIHNGKVKQIVGGSLKDAGNRADENFVSELEAADSNAANLHPIHRPNNTSCAHTGHSRQLELPWAK